MTNLRFTNKEFSMTLLRKLVALLLSAGLLVGCTSTTEPVEVSSSIQDSQEMQADDETSQPADETEGTDTKEAQIAEPIEPAEEEQIDQADSTPAPISYELASELVDDEICKLKEDSGPRKRWADVPATGFPLNTYGATVSQFGTAKVKVVFLEWEDLRGTQADYDYHVEELNRAILCH